MSDTGTLLGDLADACLAQADDLQQRQAALGYKGDDAAHLHAKETALRAQVLILNTAAISANLAASDEAQAKLKAGTKTANDVIADIKSVAQAIQISADLLALAASAASGNPGGIISAAEQLIKDAGPLLNPSE